MEPLYIGPTRDIKNLEQAFDHMAGTYIGPKDICTFKLDDGVYTHEGADICEHPNGAQINISGNWDYPDRVNLIYHKGAEKCTGIYVGKGYRLGGINGLTIECDAPNHPADMHAMGIFGYYNSMIQCGPELKTNYGSQTRLIIRGFTVGACASKNSSLQADGVIIENCMIGTLAGHGSIVHVGGATLRNITPGGLHFQSYGNGSSVYCDNLSIEDTWVKAWAAYGAGIVGGGVTGPQLILWDVVKDPKSFVMINGVDL